MPKITMEVDVPEITPDELREAVIQACVDRVLSNAEAEEGSAFVKDLRSEASSLVREKVEKVMEARAVSVVEEVLSQKFHPVDDFGDAHPETTLRQMIGEYGTRYLLQEVDSNGRPLSYRGQSGTQSRIHYLVRKLVEEVFQQELRKSVEEATTEFKALMAGKISTEIVETVSRLLGLKAGR